ncbi:Receptor-type guanylate cyclase gcy [Seminavis robusta]|uniref:Receptor-type guanylate cyclase gcy n=1 Tax=Seminavis robusta TaxID=568900 RepID=A0A9N8H8S7_9STRA|nr:Receptor-type guanylate cyclase gcy [Seminavis robusta]|eukprot:Sro98_g050670.1 Receptor-type guanylate cyclase gcy (787) ;mRNA; r:115480-118274
MIDDSSNPHKDVEQLDLSMMSIEYEDEHKKAQEETVEIAHDETKVVTGLRVVLMIVLVAVAIAVCLTAYFTTREAEVNDFESAFENYANKIIDSFQTESGKKTSAITSMAIALTSHAQHSNESWPFVTLPDFELKARVVLDLAELLSLMVLPLVTKEQARQYGAYAAANQDWYWEGLAIQAKFRGQDNITGTAVNRGSDWDASTLKIRPFIITMDGFNDDGSKRFAPFNETHEGPFFPVGQYSPQVPIPLSNIDFFKSPIAGRELDFYYNSNERRNIVGLAQDFTDRAERAAFANAFLERYIAGGNAYTKGPLSFFYSPVYERIADPTAPLVAVMQCLIFWETFFDNLLPEGVKGIMATLENDCGQTYSYRIDGKKAEYLGDYDMHDTTYDHLSASSEYGLVVKNDQQAAGMGEPSSYDGYSGCNYRIRVYPSKEMEDQYVTSQPLVIALAMLGVFLVTTAIFVTYDRFVERRQKLVMETAVQSSDVVNQLFPETVRDRLYANDDAKAEAKCSSSFLNRASERWLQPEATTSEGVNPIADEYPNCTVLFADIAGFTKWSATRTPTDVFYLLETLFGAIDKTAKRLGVFKIETIGDCYVAVTGLPRPRADHASVMAKFASRAMSAMNHLINSEDLILRLGEDTAQLSMRVGLHSGPVTAGVLRGEKARFQLFGDTVNTASRMESNGQKGRIHVSQSTADSLVAAGRSHWLTKREDLVEAKGKGSMQTYWVNISAGAGSTTGSMISSVEVGSTPSLNNQLGRAIDEDKEQAMPGGERHEPRFDDELSI